MGRESDAEFFGITNEAFTFADLKRLSEIELGHTAIEFAIEPLSYNSSQLLQFYYEFCERNINYGIEVSYEQPEFSLEFNEIILPRLGIELGEEMIIENSRIFIDSKGKGLVAPDERVVGNLVGVYPYEMFFIEQNDVHTGESSFVGTGISVPYVALRNTYLVSMNGEQESLGNAVISLWNGSPYIYRKVI